MIREQSARLRAATAVLVLCGGLAALPATAAPASTSPAAVAPGLRGHDHTGSAPHAHEHRAEPVAGADRTTRRSPRDPRFEQLTGDLSPRAHVPFEHGTDMQFQRRAGGHLRAGQPVAGPRDYVFVGTDASEFASAGGAPPRDGVGFRVIDVSRPAAPEVLAEVACPGYGSDIAVYEDLLLQAVERHAPFHGVEGAASNTGCARRHDPRGLDVPGAAGLRVFDISDPARPRLVRFVRAQEFGGGGVHTVTVVPWAGLAYLSTFTLLRPEPRLVYLDLRDARIPATAVPMRSISPTAVNECHDIGVDPVRRLAFCGAFEQGHIWDVSDARRPRGLATMTNDGIFHYHTMRLAPDGRTLVIAAEQTGPDEVPVSDDAGAGGNACVGHPRSGALWFYDLGEVAAPRLLGTFAPRTPMPGKGFCTSHLYNFIPGSDRLVTAWMDGGAFVVDYGRLPGLRGTGDPAPLSAAVEQSWFLPAGSSFWSAYYWHGHLYGLGYGGSPGGGLWVMSMKGVADVAPAPQDEGTAWARWTPRPVPQPGAGGRQS